MGLSAEGVRFEGRPSLKSGLNIILRRASTEPGESAEAEGDLCMFALSSSKFGVTIGRGAISGRVSFAFVIIINGGNRMPPCRSREMQQPVWRILSHRQCGYPAAYLNKFFMGEINVKVNRMSMMKTTQLIQ